jgi:hypothetical protein
MNSTLQTLRDIAQAFSPDSLDSVEIFSSAETTGSSSSENFSVEEWPSTHFLAV